MINEKAQKLITAVFDKIENCRSVEELKNISVESLSQDFNFVKFDEEKYPEICFSISSEEMKELKQKGKITDNNHLNIVNGDLDPLAKLLYAIIWKNGDIKKVQHVIEGILDSDKGNSDRDKGIVFYHFGKNLANPHKEPIIDQHILRAFGIYKADNAQQVLEYRKLNTIKKKHLGLIDEYKKWLSGLNVNQSSYVKYVDKILFSVGKAVKFKRKENE